MPWGYGVVSTTRRAHRKTLTGIAACAIAYVFVLQATLAATLNAWLPPGLPTSSEICLSLPGEHTGGDNRIDADHVKAASRCSLCLVPGFGLLTPPPSPGAIVIRTALGITFEPHPLDRVVVTEAPSPHRARAPPPAVI